MNNPQYRAAGYDSRYPNAPHPPIESYKEDYNACDAVPVEEPLTSQITNRLDQALKDVDQLTTAVVLRADSLFGPTPPTTLGNEKMPPRELDSGVMSRISRQSRELLRNLEQLEYQFRRFNQL